MARCASTRAVAVVVLWKQCGPEPVTGPEVLRGFRVISALKPNRTGAWSPGNRQPAEIGFGVIFAPKPRRIAVAATTKPAPIPCGRLLEPTNEFAAGPNPASSPIRAASW